MSAPLWVQELAEAFWNLAGEEEGFPRALRRPIAAALPLTIVSLPRLQVRSANEWLRTRGIGSGAAGPDRRLRACLVAHRDHGIIFLDGVDGEDEQRFSLAHELAHFLRDYWQPRRLACERFGPTVLEVFDGDRPPHQEERIHTLLAGVPIGYHTHLMQRGEEGEMPSGIEPLESSADRLAFELLAPANAVLEETRHVPAEGRRRVTRRTLEERYGLPSEQAARYASLLVPPLHRADSLVQRLRVMQ